MVDSPSGGAPAKAPRWDLVDTEGYCGGNSFSLAPRWDLVDTEGYGGGNSFSLAPFDIPFLRNTEIGKKK